MLYYSNYDINFDKLCIRYDNHTGMGKGDGFSFRKALPGIPHIEYAKQFVFNVLKS